MRPSKRIRGVQPIAVKKPKANSASKADATDAIKTVGAPVSNKRTPSMKFSHVEVPSLASLQLKTPEATADEASSDEESEVPRRHRVAATKVRYNDAFDDDDDEPPKKKNRITKYKSARSSSPEAFVPSDDDEDEDEDVDSEDFEDDVSDEDSDARKAKSKPKAKPKVKGKAKPKESDSEAMDVDEDEGGASSATSASASKKRKREDTAKEKKEKSPKPLREVKDPWKLRGAAKRDWVEVQAPPLEMFHFARKVVDEYTYLDGIIHTLITKVTADRSWVLSGTPPIHDFGAVKTIAAFLDVHLGVDDDGEGQSAQIKKRRREQTGMLRFFL